MPINVSTTDQKITAAVTDEQVTAAVSEGAITATVSSGVGASGTAGASATITVGTVTTGTPAAVTNVGTSSAAVLNFVIPAGATGAAGAKGDQGDQGPAGATGAQGPAGSSGVIAVTAPITNSGTSSSATIGISVGSGLSVSGGTLIVSGLGIADISGLQTALDGKAAASHAHAATDITSGTLDAARLPLGTTSAAGAVIVGSGLSVTTGTVSANVTSVAGRTGAVTIAAADVSGLAASATTDATNASNIGSGTLNAARLPNTTVTAGSYGSASSVATFTVDAAGRLTAAGSTAIAISSGAVSVSATDKLLGRSSSGAGAVEEITCTAAGRAILDDADAAAQRTTLSAQKTITSGTAAPTGGSDGDIYLQYT